MRECGGIRRDSGVESIFACFDYASDSDSLCLLQILILLRIISDLDICSFQIEELTLKSSASTELKILFDEPWLVQVSHSRLKGDVPMDREWNTLSALSGVS
jgi:hypothetical protein